MRYCVTLLGIACAGVSLAADVSVVEEIICKVNGDIVTRNEIEKGRKQLESDLRQQGLNGVRLQDAAKEASKNILRERIDQLLLVQRAKELNIKVDADVTKELADIQRNTKVADPEKFQQLVREQTGMPFEDYKGDLTNQLLTQRVVRQEVSSKIQIKKEDLEKYYNEHKDDFMRQERVFLREILVSTEDKDAAVAAAAEKKAKDLVARARKGERFQEMAQANSDASASALQGGDIGPWEQGKLRKDIEDAVWNQPRGYVTDPIKTDIGFQIYKVEDHQKAGLAQFEEVETVVQEKLFAPQMQPKMREYLTKLRAQAFLEIKPGYEDAGAAPGKDTRWKDPAELKPETVTKEEVLNKARRKHLLGVIPLPGTSAPKTGSSSSR
jgi:peptidyl-prolyl cis-trans isomerase SurA